METLSKAGFILATLGFALAVGIPVSVRVYHPAAGSVPVFKFAAKVGLAMVVVGVLLALVGLVGWAIGQ